MARADPCHARQAAGPDRNVTGTRRPHRYAQEPPYAHRTAVRRRHRGRPARVARLAAGGDRITRTYRLPNHFAAAGLTVHVAQIQEELNHHSDLTLGYNTVALAVNSHDAGGAVTSKDLALAARVEAIAAGHGAR